MRRTVDSHSVNSLANVIYSSLLKLLSQLFDCIFLAALWGYAPVITSLLLDALQPTHIQLFFLLVRF